MIYRIIKFLRCPRTLSAPRICLKHSIETLNITNSMMRHATAHCCKCVTFTIKVYKYAQ